MEPKLAFCTSCHKRVKVGMDGLIMKEHRGPAGGYQWAVCASCSPHSLPTGTLPVEDAAREVGSIESPQKDEMQYEEPVLAGAPKTLDWGSIQRQQGRINTLLRQLEGELRVIMGEIASLKSYNMELVKKMEDK